MAQKINIQEVYDYFYSGIINETKGIEGYDLMFDKANAMFLEWIQSLDLYYSDSNKRLSYCKFKQNNKQLSEVITNFILIYAKYKARVVDNTNLSMLPTQSEWFVVKYIFDDFDRISLGLVSLKDSILKIWNCIAKQLDTNNIMFNAISINETDDIESAWDLAINISKVYN